MKDPVIFSIFTAGGFGVLVGYFMLYIYGYLNLMTQHYTKKEWYFWTSLMVLTTASVIGVIVYFSFLENLDDDWRPVFISSLSVFLASAMLWSVSIAYLYKNNKSKEYQRPFLLLTGLATVGILLATCYSTNNWLVIVAAAIIVFHHLIIDAFWWMTLHKRIVNYKSLPKKVRYA
jgi:uncharacterized membrane protein YfcA